MFITVPDDTQLIWIKNRFSFALYRALCMQYKNLRDFIAHLENLGELKRVTLPVDPRLETTEICCRTLHAHGPALLFEKPKGFDIPLLGNLFGTTRRVALAMGHESIEELREVGKLLSFLKEPQVPRGIGDAVGKIPEFRQLLHVLPRVVGDAPCRKNVMVGADVDLAKFPIQTCWPNDVGPLITFGLVITKGPYKERENIGIYRQQVIGRNKVIMRWLPHRGGAIDFREWKEARPGRRFPVVVVIGADPATLLAAVTPIPDTLSEFQFAGLLRGARSEVLPCHDNTLHVPATAEIVLEGHIDPAEEALEGPFGDHTGYYNSQEKFPVFTIERITHTDRPVYHSAYMGRSPYDEPSSSRKGRCWRWA